MTAEKVELGRKSLTFFYVQIFLGTCKGVPHVHFFNSKYVSRTIRDIFKELASTPMPVNTFMSSLSDPSS